MPKSPKVLDLSILSKSIASTRFLTITSCSSRSKLPLTPHSAREEHHCDVSCGDMARTSMCDKRAAAPAKTSRVNEYHLIQK